MLYRQTNDRADVSIERETDRVPHDRRYYVFRDGELVASFRSLKAAQECYRKLIEEKHLPPLEIEKIPVSTERMLDEAWTLRSNKSLLGTPGSSKGKKSGKFHKVR